MLLWLRACGFYLLGHLAKGKAKLNVSLEASCVNAVLLAVGRRFEFKKSELDGVL